MNKLPHEMTKFRGGSQIVKLTHSTVSDMIGQACNETVTLCLAELPRKWTPTRNRILYCYLLFIVFSRKHKCQAFIRNPRVTFVSTNVLISYQGSTSAQRTMLLTFLKCSNHEFHFAWTITCERDRRLVSLWTMITRPRLLEPLFIGALSDPNVKFHSHRRKEHAPEL